LNEEKEIGKSAGLTTQLNSFLERVKNTWGMSEKGQTAVSASMAMLSTKHGLYATIPIICKVRECPYKSTCQLLKDDLAPNGEPCPMEIAKIMYHYEKYSTELNIEDGDEVDKSLLRDLINYEIMLDRCNAKVADEADFVIMVPFAVADTGDILEHPELSRAVEFRDRIQKKKNEVLQLLNSTRKDKADQNLNVQLTPTQLVEQLIAKAREFDSVVEAEYEVEDEKKEGQ
jgi:hypothetical protein